MGRFTYLDFAQKKGREITLPANPGSRPALAASLLINNLFEPCHDLVDDSEQNLVIVIVFGVSAESIGMRVE